MNKCALRFSLCTVFFLLSLSSCELLYEFGFLEKQNSGSDRPYVVLISIDGYRYDFTEKFHPPNLSALSKEATVAESMIPVYPPDTFPDHYSVATGLYPENHGIVGSYFYDPDRKEEYRRSKKEVSRDPVWYGGTPFWVAAEKQGVIAASMFWPGSEAPIQGVRPSYFYYYDNSIGNSGRADQVNTWLDLPESKRPHMINVYFAEVDDKAHLFGVFSKEVKNAVMDIDRAIGKLVRHAKARNLPVNFIIVGPHGIQDLDSRKTVYLEDLTDVLTLHIVGDKSRWNIYFDENEGTKLERVYAELKSKQNHFHVYKREEVPERLHYSKSRRCGDLVIVADTSYSVKLARDSKRVNWNAPVDRAAHGYDPFTSSNMHGIFYAVGPNIKKGLKIPSFESIHVYPLLMMLLGLDVLTPIDGDPKVLENIIVGK